VGVPPVTGELAAGAPPEPPVRWAQYCTEVHSTFLRRVLELAMRLPADLAALLEPLSEHYHVLPTSVECGAPSVLAAGRDELVVACGVGALRLTEVQLEGGRRIPASAFLAGHSVERFE
jgi:hypothetical protein